MGKQEITGRGGRKAEAGKVRKTKGEVNGITRWGGAGDVCREGTGASPTGRYRGGWLLGC